ncbi:CBN-NHR-237 protein [Caenorhabditis brenneri]|uniref:CBN-NHR-237 protein n=1 Tax=Caenorhabditis brenneri TaxID=135651 RepID=G0M9R2_CAEBE|nr:CBN-NHR-237 protein [Caenorhabditis brenneri]
MESPPSLQICGVCEQTADAVHFGALSCRACAAFFRRRVAANKLHVVSRCAGNCKLEGFLHRKLCSNCRLQKCLDIGMKPSAVLSRLTVKMEPGTSSMCLLDQMKTAYLRLENARKEAFQKEGRIPKTANYKELNELCSIDLDLIIVNYTSMLQSITPTDEEQRRLLGIQFLVPFCLLDGAFRSQYVDSDLFLMPNGDYVELEKLNKFYENPEENDKSIAGGVTSLMRPYWRLNNQVLRNELKSVLLDLSEFLFVSALIFWDFGITNQSEECIQICKQMRSRVIEELTSYEKSIRKDDHPMRVGAVVMVLQAVQKAYGIMDECRDISMVYNLYGRECPLFRVPQNTEFR